MKISSAIKGHHENLVSIPAGWLDDVLWVNSSDSLRPNVGNIIGNTLRTRQTQGKRTDVVALDLELAFPSTIDPVAISQFGRYSGFLTAQRAIRAAVAAVESADVCAYPLGSVNQWAIIQPGSSGIVNRAAWLGALSAQAGLVELANRNICAEFYFDSVGDDSHVSNWVPIAIQMARDVFGPIEFTAIVMPQVAFGPSAGQFVRMDRFRHLLRVLSIQGVSRVLVFGGVGGPGERTASEWNAWLSGYNASDTDPLENRS